MYIIQGLPTYLARVYGGLGYSVKQKHATEVGM